MSSQSRFKLGPVEKPKRKRAKPLPVGVRRQIKQMLLDGKTVAQIKLRFKRYDPTDSQIDGIKYSRCKLVNEPRKDSYDAPGQSEPIRKSSDVMWLMRDQLLQALNDLYENNFANAGKRFSGLNVAALINVRITKASIVSALGRRDADVIAAIVKRYEPAATEEDVIRIYRESVDKVQHDAE